MPRQRGLDRSVKGGGGEIRVENASDPEMRAITPSTTFVDNAQRVLYAKPHELRPRLTRRGTARNRRAIWVNRCRGCAAWPKPWRRNSRNNALLRPAKATAWSGPPAQAVASEEPNADTGACGRGRASRRMSTPTGGTMKRLSQ